jgi:D-3-phosphoglycerate dehydrogenase
MSDFRVVIADQFAAEGLAILAAAEGIEILDRSGISAADLAELMPTVDGLGVRSNTVVTADLIAASGGRLKAVVRAGVGTDNIDKPAAAEAGVAVMNTPFGNTVSAAEHAVGLIFAISRNIPQATASMKAGRWEKKKLTGRQLTGRTAGVVGFGNIGKVVADRLVGLRMNVLVSDPIASAEEIAALGATLVPFEELLAAADYVTLHVPLIGATKHMINAETLAIMKPDAYLVCAARGGVVDEAALLAALDAGHLSGAALDVFIEEPPPAGHPLVAHPRVICSPHLGASTREAQLQVSIDAAEQLIDALCNGNVVNRVN